MIIKSLKLENYRRFEKCELELPENLIGIIGRNGSGKSTIIEAIGWTLYGNKFGRSDKKDVRSNHVDEKAVCKAEMVFAYGGEEYRVVRLLKGKNATSEAAVYRGGVSEAVAVQDRGVNEFIENLLQLDYRSFTTSVFAQQKELAKLSGLQPEQRRQAVNRLINIDRIDRAREQVRRDRNEKNAFLKGKKSALKDETILQEQKKQLQVEFKIKSTEKEKSLQNEKNTADKLAALKIEFEKIVEVRDQYNQQKARLEKTETQIKQNNDVLVRSQTELTKIQQAEKEWKALQPQLKEMPSVTAQKEIMDEAYKKFNQLQMQLKEKELLQNSIDKEKKELAKQQKKLSDADAIEKQLKDADARIAELEKEITALQQKMTIAANDKAVAAARGKELKQKTDTIQELGPDGECPVCTQHLGDHYEQVLKDQTDVLKNLRDDYASFQNKEKAFAAEIQDKETELRRLRGERDTISKKANQVEQARDQMKSITEHVDNYKKQIGFVDAHIKEIGQVKYDEKEHDRIKQKYSDLTALDKKAASLKTEADRKQSALDYIESTEKTLALLQEDVKKLAQELKALNYEEKIYLQQKKDVELANNELTKIREERASIERQCALLENNIQNITKEITEQKKAREEIAETEQEIHLLNALDEHFGRFRLELAGRIRPLIAERASELLSLTTHSRYHTLQLDEDYNIGIVDGNTLFPIERFSGGEQDLANLCLRIAISQVVAERSGGAPINLIVLDEIFGSQDDERRDRIVESLQQLSSQFRQIFVITHINEIKDMLPVILHVQAKDEQTSVAELV